MLKGTIRRIMDRGFGFIKTDDETDIFFHRNDIEGVEFNSLSEGQEVEFEKGQGRDGRSRAVKVRFVKAQADDDSGSGDDSSGGDGEEKGEGEG